MSKTERKSFILYHSFMNQFGLLTMEERGELITAIFAYEIQGTLPQGLSRTVEMAFSFMRDTIDRDREEYLRICEKRADGGKKGGRPRKETDAEENHKVYFGDEKTLRFFEKAKKPDNENDIDIDIDNDNDIDIDNENENENNFSSVTAPPSLYAAPQLSKEEREELLNKGVPPSYLAEKTERAAVYAHGGKRVADVLWDWWQSDRERRSSATACSSPRSAYSAPKPFVAPRLEQSTYDLDDFFALALAKSEREFAKEQEEAERKRREAQSAEQA